MQELRLPVTRLEKQAMVLAIMAGENNWRQLGPKEKNQYRRHVVSFIQGCGIESVVITDGVDETSANTSEERGEGEHSSNTLKTS